MVADLFHIGHINLFKKARNIGNYLIVGIHSDSAVKSYKRVPIINENDRYEIVRQCRLVDQIITKAPLNITKDFIEKHNIDYVVHGDDKSPALLKQHQIARELGIMRYIGYTKGISTTKIINDIQNLNIINES